ncbi:hypothetical protein PoB_004704300 [Plakobranchus ocellatus]|uniref:Uncharacterized protein n=1 Tax=Plakobranchus ocellatus TaxID=259542 RepID=A0AAV4BN30_9GAST|nr:hypothetical protein PoB_004704300 [Plakobranchus ocellatus]
MNKAGTTTSGNDQSRSVAPLQQVKKRRNLHLNRARGYANNADRSTGQGNVPPMAKLATNVRGKIILLPFVAQGKRTKLLTRQRFMKLKYEVKKRNNIFGLEN